MLSKEPFKEAALDSLIITPANAATAAPDSQVVTHSLLWSPRAEQDWYNRITDDGIQFMCKLTKLQSLELHNIDDVTAAGLAGLHALPALKHPGLDGVSCGINASALPAFTQLTALTYLKLGWTHRPRPDEFNPSVLAHMTQLEELRLHEPRPAGGASGAAELLARLGQLPKLQVLRLANVRGLVHFPPAAFSSLASSSMLRSLSWSCHRYQPGPWQHLCSGRLSLSALTALETAYGPHWQAADLDQLSSSCGQLQKLSLHCTPGLQLTALLQLSSISQLWLQGWTGSSTIASLAQLSGLARLQRLAVPNAREFNSLSGIFFMPLTALTQLTYLALPQRSALGASMQQRLREVCVEPSHITDPWPDVYCPVIASTAPAGAPPDVWSQLLSCCEGGTAAPQQHMGAPAAAAFEAEEQQQQVELGAAPQQQQHGNEEAEEEEPLAGPEQTA